MIWDESKRKTNLEKHGLDFADAWLVHENPGRVTLSSKLVDDEVRYLEVAYAEAADLVLALVYTVRGEETRPIAFRRASRRERRRYEKAIKD
jgi:uncharacterized protein